MTSSLDALPIIDLSPWYNTADPARSPEGAQIVSSVRDACEKTGFLVVRGIPAELTDAISWAEAMSKTFFSDPSLADLGSSCLASKHGDGAYGYF